MGGSLFLVLGTMLLQAALVQPPAAEFGLVADQAEDLVRGKRLFEAHCSRCHGMQGAGGEGPSLARPTLARAPDDDALLSVIQDGIAGTGMPATWAMSEDEALDVVAYVRSLGRTTDTEIPGDPGRGAAIYDGKGGCAACHIIDGAGGNLGPDLSEVGARRGPDHLREALLDPGASLPKELWQYYPAGYAQYLVVRVVTNGGREMRGIRVNEDAFTIQLRDEADRFHSYRKSELRELDKQFGVSLMPSYEGNLSDSEIDDLVAYLASLRGEE